MIESLASTATESVHMAAVEMRPYNKRQQLLQELLQNGDLLVKNRLEVRHLMTRDPLTVPPTMACEELTNLMHERRVRHLLVCGRGDELIGVISDRDLRSPRGSTAQQVMSLPVLTATPDTPLNPAITFLINENISCLPIVDQGRPCGILTTTDLALGLQCVMQLWLRMAQILQHDTHWVDELDQIVGTLDQHLSPPEFAAQVESVRATFRRHLDDIVNRVDLHTDGLTGLASRHNLEAMLNMLLAQQKRYGQPFSLVIVAVDHYQQIAATLGDVAIKPLLKAVGAMIQRSVRHSDFVARCRDDAFAVALTQTDLTGADAFCRRICETARHNAEFEIPLRISTSAVLSDAGESADALLRRAEAALEPRP